MLDIKIFGKILLTIFSCYYVFHLINNNPISYDINNLEPIWFVSSCCWRQLCCSSKLKRSFANFRRVYKVPNGGNWRLYDIVFADVGVAGLDEDDEFWVREIPSMLLSQLSIGLFILVKNKK